MCKSIPIFSGLQTHTRKAATIESESFHQFLMPEAFKIWVTEPSQTSNEIHAQENVQLHVRPSVHLTLSFLSLPCWSISFSFFSVSAFVFYHLCLDLSTHLNFFYVFASVSSFFFFLLKSHWVFLVFLILPLCCCQNAFESKSLLNLKR